jgi:hypothetical protein
MTDLSDLEVQNSRMQTQIQLRRVSQESSIDSYHSEHKVNIIPDQFCEALQKFSIELRQTQSAVLNADIFNEISILSSETINL